jgi:hypothetical protein
MEDERKPVLMGYIFTAIWGLIVGVLIGWLL